MQFKRVYQSQKDWTATFGLSGDVTDDDLWKAVPNEI